LEAPASGGTQTQARHFRIARGKWTLRLPDTHSKQGSFTNSRGVFDRENQPMKCAMRLSFAAPILALASAIVVAAPTHAATPAGVSATGFAIAQAMVPPTGMMDAKEPTPMEQRYLDRYPQPVRVGDLIGLPVLDLNASTIGYVRQVVRTQQGKIELIVSYGRWWGWFGRPVAVPLEAVGIAGRQLVSLDMQPREYAAAPTWQGHDAAILPVDTMIRVALARA
jgi:hypothetical protein